MPCKITGARLAYTRYDILSIRTSPNLAPLSLRTSVAVVLVLSYPGRKKRRIQVLSRRTADPVAVPSPDFYLRVTDRRAGPDFNNPISIALSPHPKSTPADTLRVALFSARSVNDPPKRAEISTVISDNQVDILFFYRVLASSTRL